jgi:hypothetical protein
MYGTIMRFDSQLYKPYKRYDKEIYFGIPIDQEKLIISAKEQYEVKENSELPNEVTIKGFQLIKKELKELHYDKSKHGTNISSHELILEKAFEIEIQANQIFGLWYQG